MSVFIRAHHPAVVALVGAGGSGKTTLAAALGHKLRRFFSGRLVWLRIGAWDKSTVLSMIASQLGAFGEAPAKRRVRRALSAPGGTLVVLDNHEDDAVTARILAELRGLPVTWIITARRCLLGGVTVVPVVPALIAGQQNPFPAIAALTPLLRWHPVALDIANAIVKSGLMSVSDLERRLRRRGVDRIVPVRHEDDIPEVKAVVLEAMRFVSPASRRMLAVLATIGGDSIDVATLATLADVRARATAIESLSRLRLVQTPAEGRVAIHATVRYSLEASSRFDIDRYAAHYIAWFEREPASLVAEQTHLYALMDWAQERSDLTTILRVDALAVELSRIECGEK